MQAIRRIAACSLLLLTPVTIAAQDAARTLIRAGKVGSIEPGKWAGIIAVQGDPLQDVRILQHVAFVMKAGVVYKNQAQ